MEKKSNNRSKGKVNKIIIINDDIKNDKKTDLGMNNIELDQIEFDKLGLDKFDLDKLGLDKFDLDKLGLNIVGLDKLESNKIESDDVELDKIELNNNETIKRKTKKKKLNDIDNITINLGSKMKNKVSTEPDLKQQTKHSVILNDDDKLIKFLYHISDIHIKLYGERHDEYRQVFERLYEKLKEETDNFLIVITGDTVNNNLELDSTSVDLLKSLIISLSEIANLVVILGNHDLNSNSLETIDSISANVKGLQTKNKVHILLNNEVYVYNNIAFILTTMDAPYPTKYDQYIGIENKKKVGLYHSIINGAKTDSENYLLSKHRFNTTDFTKLYDIVLLGDVHMRQYLTKDKRIAYAGSLLQNNYSETIENKGIIKWHISDDNYSEFIDIKNDYTLNEINITRKTYEDLVTKKSVMSDYNELLIGKYPRFRLIYNDNELTKEEARECGIVLTKKYGGSVKLMKSLYKKKKNVNNCGKNDGDKDKNNDGKIDEKMNDNLMIDLKNNDDVVNAIIEYIKKHRNCDENCINNVKIKLNEIINNIDYDYNNNCKTFEIIRLEFCNYFQYAELNVIDFTKLSEITGIYAKNHTGKSTLIDIIIYSIWGDPLRGNCDDIINNKKKYAGTKIIFKLDGIKYIIERKRRIRSQNTRLSNEIVKFTKGDTNLTLNSVTKTNEYIKKIISEKEIFMDVSIITQCDVDGFKNYQSKKKKEMLFKLFNLNIYKKIGDDASEELKILQRDQDKLIREKLIETNGKKKLKNKDVDQKVEYKNHGEKITKQKEESDVKLGILKEEKKILENKLMESEIEIRYCDDKMNKLNETLLKYGSNENIDDNIYIKIQQEELTLVKIDEEYIDTQLKIQDIENALNNTDILLKYDTYMKTKELQIDKLEKLNRKLMLEYKSENKYSYDINIIIEYCEKYNNIIKDLDEKICNINNLNSELKNKIENEVDTTELIDKYNLYDDMDKERIILIEQKKNIQEKIDELKTKRNDFKEYVFNPLCEACVNNQLNKIKQQAYDELQILRESRKQISKQMRGNDKKLDELRPMYDEYNKIMETIKKNNEYLKSIKENNDRLGLLKADLELNKYKNDTNNKNFDDYKKFIDTQNRNSEILKLIDVNSSEIKQLVDEKMIEYEEYKHKLSQLNKLNDAIRKITKKKYECEKDLDDMKKRNEGYESYKKQYELINTNKKLKEKYVIELKEKTQINQKHKETFDEIKFKIDQCEYMNTQLKNDIEIFKSNIDKYESMVDSILTLSIITETCKTGGIVDYLLNHKILPELKTMLNDILSYIGKYDVNITLNENDAIQIDKICGDEKFNIDCMSGSETILLNLCFRIAMAKNNNLIDVQFLILDETFIYLDDQTMTLLSDFFEYIKKYYKWIIIMSHEKSIIKLYDNILTINVDNEGSHIKYD